MFLNNFEKYYFLYYGKLACFTIYHGTNYGLTFKREWKKGARSFCQPTQIWDLAPTRFTQTFLYNQFQNSRACIIKLITAVIYSFRSKLECLSINTRLGWKGLPGTNTLAYYGNRKLQPLLVLWYRGLLSLRCHA